MATAAAFLPVTHVSSAACSSDDDDLAFGLSATAPYVGVNPGTYTYIDAGDLSTGVSTPNNLSPKGHQDNQLMAILQQAEEEDGDDEPLFIFHSKEEAKLWAESPPKGVLDAHALVPGKSGGELGTGAAASAPGKAASLLEPQEDKAASTVRLPSHTQYQRLRPSREEPQSRRGCFNKRMQMQTMPVWMRILLLAVANLTTFLVGAPVFGLPVFLSTLLGDGIFSDRCAVQVMPARSISFSPSCGLQAYELASVFLLGVSCFWLAVGPALWLVAGWGSLLAASTGTLLATVALLLLAYLPTPAVLSTATALLCFGGPLVVLSFLHLTNLFPASKGFILTLFSVTTDGSSMVFALIALGGSHSWRGMCAGYALMVGGLFLAGFSLWRDSPDMLLPHAKEDNPPESPTEDNLVPAVSPRSDIVTFRMADQGLSSQLLSPAYMLGGVFFVIHMLRSAIFYATSYFHLLPLVPNATEAHDWMVGLGLVLPLLGILSVPYTGWLLRKYPLWFNIVLLNVGMLLFGILLLIPWLPALVMSMGLFFMLRSHLFWVMTNYFATLFGCTHFRALWGLVFGAAGVLNLILVCPIVANVLAADASGIAPTSIVGLQDGSWSRGSALHMLNVYLSFLTLLLFIFPVWLVSRRRRVKKYVDLDENSEQSPLKRGFVHQQHRPSYGYSEL